MMSYLTSAQTFIYNGLIEYECRTNNHKLMKEESPEWFESSKDRIPKYSIVFNNLIFDTCRTLYYPGKEPEQKPPFWGDEGIPDDYIFSDLSKHIYVGQKEVFDQTFLIQDSTKNIKWKLTQETRDIAGFECKKATTIIMDSVFIIAYYTDKIICNGGPLSVNGLPGMILGMVVPRIHSTWFAIKVTPQIIAEDKKLIAPKKGKKATNLELSVKLRETFKEWGKSYIISFML